MAKVYFDKRKKKWICDYTIAGVRSRPTFETKTDADLLRRELLLRPIDSVTGFVRIKDVTLFDASQEYLDTVSALKDEDTHSLEKNYFEKLLRYAKEQKPSLKFVSQVTLLNLERFQAHLRKSYEASTVNRHFNTYKHFFKKCKKWNYLSTNPAIDLPGLPENRKKPVKWTSESFDLVCREVEPWVADAFFFVAKTGARRGEMTSLERGDVDMQAKLISLKSWKGGKCSIREVPMTDELYFFMDEKLKSHRHNGVFAEPTTGKQFNKAFFSKQMERAVKKAGLSKLTLHGLRHSLLTDLARMNVSLRKIQNLAGHKRLSTTQDYLDNVGVEDLREDLERHENVVKLFSRRSVAPNLSDTTEKEAK